MDKLSINKHKSAHIRLAFFIVIAIIIALGIPSLAFAHSGGTDSYGGHHDYNNVSGLGEYHYHHGYGPHMHEDGYCPMDGQYYDISPDDPNYTAESDTTYDDTSSDSTSSTSSTSSLTSSTSGSSPTFYYWWEFSKWELWKQLSLIIGIALVIEIIIIKCAVRSIRRAKSNDNDN